MSLSTLLYDRLDRVVGALGSGGAPLGYNPSNPGTLRQWFVLMWHVVRASVPLLDAAREALRDARSSGLISAASDGFAADLDDYYRRHREEERAHDEWLLADLELLGVAPATLRQELVPAPIAAMVGSQYYIIRHFHPAMLLGYMALLEGYSVPRRTVERLRDTSVAPPEAWRTYLFHADEDPQHRAELCAMLDRVPADPPTLPQALIVNALRTAAWYAEALERVAAPAREEVLP
jgi:hypothetical protein